MGILDSFDQSPLDAFIQSPLDARTGGGIIHISGGFIEEGNMGGRPITRIGILKGGEFQTVGGGFNDRAEGMTDFNDILVVAGSFTEAGVEVGFKPGTTSVSRIAQLIDGQWQPLGTGINGTARSLNSKFIDGKIVVCGFFTTAGGISVSRMALWDGTNWSSVGATFDDAIFRTILYKGDLWIGGRWSTPVNSQKLIKWNGTSFSDVANDGFNDQVAALTIDISGNIVVGGRFTQTQDASITGLNRVARGSGGSFSAMGNGFNSDVFSLATFKNEVYAAGNFTFNEAGTTALNGIAKFDESLGDWIPLIDANTGGNGITNNSSQTYLLDFAGKLWIVGNWASDGKIAINGSNFVLAFNIARWNGEEFDNPAGDGLNDDVQQIIEFPQSADTTDLKN